MKTEVFVREGGKVCLIGTVGKGGYAPEAVSNMLARVARCRLADQVPVPLCMQSGARTALSLRGAKHKPAFRGVRVK